MEIIIFPCESPDRIISPFFNAEEALPPFPPSHLNRNHLLITQTAKSLKLDDTVENKR